MPAKRDERGRVVEIDYQMADMMWLENTDRIQQERAHGGMAPQGIPLIDAPPASPHAGIDWAVERARGERLKADLLTLELKKQLGELVELESVIDAISDCNIKARSALLQIPDRIAGQLAAESNPKNVYALLLRELENVAKTIEVGALDLARAPIPA